LRGTELDEPFTSLELDLNPSFDAKTTGEDSPPKSAAHLFSGRAVGGPSGSAFTPASPRRKGSGESTESAAKTMSPRSSESKTLSPSPVVAISSPPAAVSKQLVGRAVKKAFGELGTFNGNVLEVKDVPGVGTIFTVGYDDGDVEEMEWGELEGVLAQPMG
jgi:hypothetical protein